MLQIEKQTIIAVTPYEAKDAVKSVPAGRWVPSRKCWSFPATPLVADRLIKAIGDYGVDPLVADLASSGVYVDDIIARINDGEVVKVSDRMRHEPRSNQVIGALMMREMSGGILGWGMGAGKTYAALSMIADIVDKAVADAKQGILAKIIIICPATVVFNVWPKEIKKHLIDSHEYLEVSAMPKGTSTDRRVRDAERKLEYAEKAGRGFVFIIGTESVWRSNVDEFVHRHDWDTAIIDEIHKVETPGAKITRWVDTVLTKRSARRWGLTGTLFRKDELDAFCPVRFVEPGIFGRSAQKFRDQYAIIDWFGRPDGPKDPEAIRKEIGRVVHFVKTRDVVDFPACTEIDVFFDMSPAEMKQYKSMENDSILEVEEGTLTASNGLARLLRLQQITSGFVPVKDEDGNDRGVQVGTSKRDALEEWMSGIDDDEPIVVFTMFKSDVRNAVEACTNLGRKTYQLNGSADELDAWQQCNEPSVLVANIRSAGVGVDFTRACYGIFFSYGYSHPDYDQALRRLDRPGQTTPTILARLVANKTIDTVIASSLDDRGSGIEAAITYLKDQYGTLGKKLKK